MPDLFVMDIIQILSFTCIVAALLVVAIFGKSNGGGIRASDISMILDDLRSENRRLKSEIDDLTLKTRHQAEEISELRKTIGSLLKDNSDLHNEIKKLRT